MKLPTTMRFGCQNTLEKALFCAAVAAYDAPQRTLESYLKLALEQDEFKAIDEADDRTLDQAPYAKASKKLPAILAGIKLSTPIKDVLLRPYHAGLNPAHTVFHSAAVRRFVETLWDLASGGQQFAVNTIAERVGYHPPVGG